MKIGLRVVLLWLAALAAIVPSVATSAAPAWVPQDLRDWVPWVTRGSEYRQCPFLLGTRAQAEADFRCVWPGLLRLEVDRAGARFEQAWEVAAGEQWVPLPGDADHWPATVEVDGRPAAILEHESRPALRLAPGRYRLSGRFLWQGLPRTLAIPAEVGLLALRVEGEPVTQPRRDDGALFLARDAGAARRDDALGLQVYRLVEDAVPTRLTTRLQLEAAGSVREVTLGPVLPPAFVPQALAAPLPARLDADGRLTLQIRPGRWTVELVGRAGTLEEAIPRPAAGAAWPASEVWSYRADERLRIAVPVGMTTVDPGQAGVPAPWSTLPAFSVDPGEAFTLEQRRRGGLPGDNALSVDRQLWLDFDGEGFTVLDRVRGTMQQDWRLDMAPPWQLLGARDGRGEALLVTRGPHGEARGVEWRERALDLQALGRLPGAAGVPTTELIAAVDAVVQANRPINDDVEVKGPTPVSVAIEAELTLVSGDASAIQAAAETRLQALFTDPSTAAGVSPLQIGEDLTLDRLVATVMAVAGVKSISWTSPAADVAVDADELAVLSSLTITTTWATEA